jgi:molecular chaperone DnaK (HSP70)
VTMAVVGIDFGNLSCVLAQAERGGVKVILNENSQRQNACVSPPCPRCAATPRWSCPHFHAVEMACDVAALD